MAWEPVDPTRRSLPSGAAKELRGVCSSSPSTGFPRPRSGAADWAWRSNIAGGVSQLRRHDISGMVLIVGGVDESDLS